MFYLHLILLFFFPSYFSVPTVLIIPPGELFSPYEKLVYPFQFNVWLSLALLVAGVLTFSSVYRKFLEKSFNLGVIDFLVVVVGGSYVKLSRKSYKRIILATFLIFFLIMRTLYTAALFELITNDVKHQQIESIDEMIEKKYNFYLYPAFVQHTNETKISSRRVIIKESETASYQLKTLNSKFKGAVVSSLDEVTYRNQLNYKNFTFLISREFLMTSPIVQYFPKNSLLVESFSETFGYLKAAGLIEKWISKFMDINYIKSRISTARAPSPLTFHHLEAMFIFWVIGCTISLAIFIIEKILSRMNKRRSVSNGANNLYR
jgi:hypothetical protein